MSVSDNVARIRERIDAAARRASRDPSEIRLMGVSKFQPASAVIEAYDAGIRLFGESRVAEAVQKFPTIRDGRDDLELHMIGSLQRNKVKLGLPLFDCIESVDRDELLLELSRRGAALGVTMEILFELHTGEDSKSGYPDVDSLSRAVDLSLNLSNLRPRGLMTMAPWVRDEAPIRRSFRDLVSARTLLVNRFPDLDWSVLSMGMSNDFEIAVEEGSTLTRVGTAIFGSPAQGAIP